MSYSYRSVIDGGADSDMIFYNANIVSAQQSVTEYIGPSPLVKFIETRDAPIVRDASQYYFSIIRFAMNGPGKNLPLFIPLIQTNSLANPTQTDPDLTIYTATIAYQREWYYTDTTGATVSKIFTITPNSTALTYIPETQNPSIAPVPFAPVTGITKQDLATRYYWVYTYKHWATLTNRTFLSAYSKLWNAFQLVWNADPDIDLVASPFPYPTFDSWLSAHDVPFIKYDEDAKKFEIYGDTRAFNISGQVTSGATVAPLLNGIQPAVPAFVPPVAPVAPSVAVAKSDVYMRLFMNNNMFGLYANFNNTYLGASNGSFIYFPLTGLTKIVLPPNQLSVPTCDYTNEILFTNQEYTNILNNNPLLQNNSVVPPPSYNPYFLIPTEKQNLYWISRQDYPSTGSLWSPVGSIVFTSTLIPVKNEYTAAVLQLGSGGLASSSGNNNAFQPIISDTVIDLATQKAEGWRDFVLYEPTAEYKLSSLTASHEEIRNLDVQVFWRYRLTGELIPLSMYNCSDVSLKIMFRKIDFRS